MLRAPGIDLLLWNRHSSWSYGLTVGLFFVIAAKDFDAVEKVNLFTSHGLRYDLDGVEAEPTYTHTRTHTHTHTHQERKKNQERNKD